jgi:hypothetical protein
MAKPPNRITKKPTKPRSGERIQSADMMSSVSRLIRIASEMRFFPCNVSEPGNAVKDVILEIEL